MYCRKHDDVGFGVSYTLNGIELLWLNITLTLRRYYMEDINHHKVHTIYMPVCLLTKNSCYSNISVIIANNTSVLLVVFITHNSYQ